jgi:hypothetical protein
MRTHTHTCIDIYTLDIHLSLHYTQKNNQYNLTTLCVVKFKFLMNVVCLDTVAFLEENKKTFFFFEIKRECFLYCVFFSIQSFYLFIFSMYGRNRRDC